METEVKLCIGIISYLPRDNQDKLAIRLQRINNLINKIGEYFPGIPIMILAQCWQGVSLDKTKFKNEVYIKNFLEPLGINGARQELRKWFLESEYNTIMMLDDDADLKGDPRVAKAYLDTIYKNPGKFGEYKLHLLKLFVIPKSLYELIEIPDGGADSPNKNKRFFEDQFVIIMLQKFYKDREFKWPNVNVNDKVFPMQRLFDDVSNSAFDETGNSGWHKVYEDGQWDRHGTGNIGRKFMSLVPNKDALSNKKLLNRLLEQAGKWVNKHGGRYLTEYVRIEEFK